MASTTGLPGPATGRAVPAGRARTLAQVYRRFGEADVAGTSPLYERVALALSESGEALRAIEAAPARKRHPTVILAALHDLALAGRAPALAAAYAAADGDSASSAWPCSASRPCTPRPSAAAGRRATSWPGWQTPSGPVRLIRRRETGPGR